jgi:hypothetical protein
MAEAKDLFLNHYNNILYIGGRNRMPIYPFIQSLFYKSGMSDNAFFLTGKYVNIILSMIILILVGIILQKSFPFLHGFILFLIITFFVFIEKAAYFQSEILFYFLNFCLFLLMINLLIKPSLSLSILTGVVAGLAHLTKASILPGLLIFLFIASVKGGWIVYKNWKSQPKELRLKTVKMNLLIVPLAALTFLITVFPYIQVSKRVYGSYFYNVNSTFYIWYDSWNEATQGTKAHGDRVGWPDMPPEEIPSFSHYLQTHTIKDIESRLINGAIGTFDRGFKEYDYGTYFVIFFVVLLATQIFHLVKYKKMPNFDPLYLIFLIVYFGSYFILYSWYWPIAYGQRFILSQFMPVMFVLAKSLQEELKKSELNILKHPVKALYAFDVAVLMILAIDIHLLLTSRINTLYGGS